MNNALWNESNVTGRSWITASTTTTAMTMLDIDFGAEIHIGEPTWLKCEYCGNYNARYQECRKCGAPPK